jgi:hypothetical protein
MVHCIKASPGYGSRLSNADDCFHSVSLTRRKI